MGNDFRKLIDYFDKEKESIIPYDFSKTKDKKIKPDIKKTDFKTIIPRPKDKVKIIHEIDDIGEEKINIPVNLGFDIDVFKKIMTQKLIKEYKKYQSFEHPNISFGECVTCIRQHYYKRKNYPIDLKTFFSFSYLFLIKESDDTIISLIQNNYSFEEINKQVLSKKYFVKGNVHAIDKSSGFLYLINVVDPINFSNEPYENHKNIANIQSHILNTEYDGYNIKKNVLLYVLRDVKIINKFTFNVNGESAERYLDNGLALKKAIKVSSVPEPLGKTENQCNNCMFFNFCKNDRKSDNIVSLI